ncbi:hypothetical protein [Halalkalibaculum sp. DA384]|uniref:hypothetical protein n=1 Tax=Halalkalibaculum sp. DA384 TaxID=3373606 RepID=UPI0037544F0F
MSDDDEYIFAIQGYLDASADTQWVRVMPIRKSVDLKRDAPATVVLEHPESGQSAVMKDSLFEFVYTHAVNYWSTMNIKAGETYRLTAERSDGATSSATVTLPEDFPTPVVQMGRSGFDYVYINGIKKLADVHTRFHTESGEIVVVPHIRDTVSRRSDDYVVAIDPAEDLAALGEHNTDGYTRKEIFVAAGGPNWPPMGSIDEDLISMPEGVSNVTSGAGYLAGIVSKILPYRCCFDENGDHAPCPLE